jgi:hypothetical protein
VDVQGIILWDIIEIEFKENIRTNKFNLSFFSLLAAVVFMGHSL